MIMNKLVNYIIVLILLLAFATGCDSDKNNGSGTMVETDSVTKPDTEVRGATIYLYNKGKIKTQIISDKIIKYETQDSMLAYVLNIDIYDSTGSVSTKIVGDSGIIQESKGFVHIYGNVVVTTKDKNKLETDYLWWDSKTDKIRTDAFVKVTTEEEVVTGWGLEADNNLSRYKILNLESGSMNNVDQLENGE